MSLGFSDLGFSGGVLEENNFRPWWETVRSYGLRAMLAVSFYMFYAIHPAEDIHCRLDKFCNSGKIENNTVNSILNPTTCSASKLSLSGEDIAFVNSACFLQLQFVSKNAGILAMLASAYIFLASSWWLSVPRVISGFSLVRKCDTVLLELKIRTKDMKKMITAVGCSRNYNESVHNCQILVRTACRALWFRDLELPSGLLHETASLRELFLDNDAKSDPCLHAFRKKHHTISHIIAKGLFSKSKKFRGKLIHEIYNKRNFTLCTSLLALVILCIIGIIYRGDGKLTCSLQDFDGVPLVNFTCSHNLPERILPCALLWIATAGWQFVFFCVGFTHSHVYKGVRNFFSMKGRSVSQEAAEENLFIQAFAKQSYKLNTSTLAIIEEVNEILEKPLDEIEEIAQKCFVDSVVHYDMFLRELAYFLVSRDLRKVFAELADISNVTFSKMCLDRKGYKRFVENHYENKIEAMDLKDVSQCGCDTLHFTPHATDYEGNSLLYYIINKPDGYAFQLPIAEHLLKYYTEKLEGTTEERRTVVVAGKHMQVRDYIFSEGPRFTSDGRDGLARLLVNYGLIPKMEGRLAEHNAESTASNNFRRITSASEGKDPTYRWSYA